MKTILSTLAVTLTLTSVAHAGKSSSFIEAARAAGKTLKSSLTVEQVYRDMKNASGKSLRLVQSNNSRATTYFIDGTNTNSGLKVAVEFEPTPLKHVNMALNRYGEAGRNYQAVKIDLTNVGTEERLAIQKLVIENRIWIEQKQSWIFGQPSAIRENIMFEEKHSPSTIIIYTKPNDNGFTTNIINLLIEIDGIALNKVTPVISKRASQARTSK